MIKLLQKHGNSHALVIDRAILDAIGVDAETPLQVVVSGNSLVVTPANVGLGQTEVKESTARLRPRYAEMLSHLAK